LGVLAFIVSYEVIQLVRHVPNEELFAVMYRRILAILYFPVRDLFRHQVLTISFWCALILTLYLQRLIPADPGQKIFSISLAQDLVWFFYETVLHALVFFTYVGFITRYYNKHLSRLTITSLSQSPGWLRFLLALLLLDFLYWTQHYFNHKVPLLWRFHVVHHSQRELNFFTDFRYHVLEYLVRYTFIAIPFLILRVDPPIIVAFAIFQKWYSRFYHGNIRTNLGPLKYILVTPQSHRVHHSLEPAHRDTNFGAIFSFWDFLLGTQCKNFDLYPATGIEDEDFPDERTATARNLLVNPFYQMLYPLLSVDGSRQSSRAIAAPDPTQAELSS
jgi:sterol desaturase/sphingolipid hydroxylase (fatty acid hydroxylase superfamily)